MKRPTIEESRPLELELEVTAADGEPAASDTRPPVETDPAGTDPTGLPGTRPDALALYQRPAPAYAEPEPAVPAPGTDHHQRAPSDAEFDGRYADPAADLEADYLAPAFTPDLEADYPAPPFTPDLDADYPALTPDYPGSPFASPGYSEADYPAVQNPAEPPYPEPADRADEYPDPALELPTAELPLPDFADPPAAHEHDHAVAGPLDAILDTGAQPHPRDNARRVPRAALAVTGAALVLVGFGGLVLNMASHATSPAAMGTARHPGSPGAGSPRGAGAPAAATGTPPAAGPGAAVVTATLDGRTSADFTLVSDATSVDVHVDDLGDDLYRITTPAGSPVRPDPTTEGDEVRLALTRTGAGNGPTQVGIVLNSRVRWGLRFAGGIGTGRFDLHGGTIGGVDLAGGASSFDLSLPRPRGTLNVRMSGGVNTFQLETAGQVPVRVTARSGAGQVVLDGTTNNGVARGASFRSPGWSAGTDRIDLDAVAGFGTLRVSRD